MQDCYIIKTATELIEYIKKVDNRDPYDLYEFDYQLPTNSAWIYELKNGEVIFIPNDFRNDGLIFKNKDCFKQVVDSEIFPFDNPEKTFFDTEIERIKSIHEQIDFYRNHLNTILKFDFQDVSRDAVRAYTKEIIGRTIKKLTTDTDMMASIAVAGEVVRREINGKWILEKWYGTYNPYYEPKILNQKNRIIDVGGSLMTSIKWKVSDIDWILDRTEGNLSLMEMQGHREYKIFE